jgi:hypothetical protein
MTPAELQSIEEGICIQCGSIDVECLEDCTVHKCVDCEHTLTTTDIDICCYGEECLNS